MLKDVGFEHPGLVDEGVGNVVEVHPLAKLDPSVKITIKGDGHFLRIGPGAVLRNITISFSGSMN